MTTSAFLKTLRVICLCTLAVWTTGCASLDRLWYSTAGKPDKLVRVDLASPNYLYNTSMKEYRTWEARSAAIDKSSYLTSVHVLTNTTGSEPAIYSSVDLPSLLIERSRMLDGRFQSVNAKLMTMKAPRVLLGPLHDIKEDERDYKRTSVGVTDYRRSFVRELLQAYSPEYGDAFLLITINNVQIKPVKTDDGSYIAQLGRHRQVNLGRCSELKTLVIKTMAVTGILLDHEGYVVSAGVEIVDVPARTLPIGEEDSRWCDYAFGPIMRSLTSAHSSIEELTRQEIHDVLNTEAGQEKVYIALEDLTANLLKIGEGIL